MKRILFFLVVLLPFLAKSQTIITGKYKYTDSLTFAKYKNNSTLDSVLSVDQNGRLRLSSKSPLDTTSLSNRIDARVKYTDTANMLIPYLRKLDTTGKWLSVGYLPYLVKYSDTSAFLSAYYNKTATDSKLALKLNISDTANMLSPYARTLALGGYVPYIGATKDVNIGTKNYYGNAYFDGFTSVAASGTLITLTVSSTPSYLITGSGGQTIKLPDATTLPNGAIYVFNNNQSSGAINVNNNSNTLVKSVPSGGYLNLELIDNSSAAGSWDAHFQAPSNVSWSTNTFDYPGSITSATWNGNTIAINRGGTGASTSGGALTNLGAQPQLNGTGFVKASGTTISYDNSTYLTSADIAGKVNYTDTATMLSPYSRDYNTVHKTGVETIGGFKTFSNYTTFVDGADVIVGTTYGASGATGRFNGGIVASRGINFDNLRSPSIYANTQAFYINKSGLVSTLNIRNDTTSAYAQILQFNNNMATHYYYFPDATGTVALTSDIPSITGKLNISDTAAMLSGYKTYYPRAALSFTAGSGAYNNSTGIITIPTNTNQLTNGAGFISSYTETDPVVKAINGIVKSNGTTISAASAGTDYQAPISLTTTGSSGASTFSSNTLNVPNYTLSGLGGQPQLNGTGFVKASGTTISYDNSTYLTTTSAASTYLPLAGGILTGALNATRFYSTFQNANNNSRNSFQSYNLNEATITNGWIAADFGDNGTTSDRVVIGSGYTNKAIIGAHTGDISAWSKLYINPHGENVSIGSTTDLGYGLGIGGTFGVASTATFSGAVNVGVATGNPTIHINGGASGSPTIKFSQNSVAKGYIYTTSGGLFKFNIDANDANGIAITSDNNLRVGLTTQYSDTRMVVRGSDATSSNYAFSVQNSTPNNLFYIRNDGLSVFVLPALSANTYVSNINFTDNSSNTGHLGIIRNSTSGNGAFLGGDGILELYTNMGTSTVKSLSISTSGVASFVSDIYSAGGIVTRIGASNSIGAGSNINWSSGGTTGMVMQLNASSGLDFWRYNSGWSNTGSSIYASGEFKSTGFYNAGGALGSNASNAKNHFTQFIAGNSGITSGWIAAAFGDALGNRTVIGQYSGYAVIAGHNGDLSNWSDLTITPTGNLHVGNLADDGSGAKLQVAGDIHATGNLVVSGTTFGGVTTQAYGYGHIYKGYTGSAYDVMFINPGNAVDELQVIGGLNMTTTTAGFTVPNMTTTQKNALTKRKGMIVFDTTANLLQCWNGASWNNLW